MNLARLLILLKMIETVELKKQRLEFIHWEVIVHNNSIHLKKIGFQSIGNFINSIKKLKKTHSLSTQVYINDNSCDEDKTLFELDLFYNYDELVELYYRQTET